MAGIITVIMKWLIIILILSIVLIAGCTQNTGIVCNAPYIRHEAGCCLDTNDNKICDSDETTNQSSQINQTNQTNQTQTQNTESTTKPDTNKLINETAASVAFASGTKIIDKTGDWVSTGDQGDNPSFYPLNITDVKEVDIGIDANYLYLKVIFNGLWPKTDNNWPIINDDQLTSTNFNVGIDVDNNQQTGCLSDSGTEIMIGFGTRMNMTGGNPPGTWNGYKTSPSGIEFPEEKRYLNDYYFNEAMIGGPGYNYVMNAYPLRILNLSSGQEITLHMWAEAMSKKYHHAAFDNVNIGNQNTTDLLGYVKIKLGENMTISE